MKLLKSVLFILLAFTSVQAISQETVPLNEPDYNKPRLFADLPQKMVLNAADLDVLFGMPEGTVVNRQVTEQFRLQGTVVSVANGTDVKSVVIRSSNRAGAVFTFTKVLQADGSFNYIGRMISTQHGDAYEIVKENGQYVLNKIGYYDLLAE